MSQQSPRIFVVIPAYKVSSQIVSLVKSLDSYISRIIVVDDKCPDNSGKILKSAKVDDRVEIIFHERNSGVGGSMITGYKQAIAQNADIIVKLDGDGQMNPNLIPELISPIIKGEADYVKGNRFSDVEDFRGMPKVRIIGNIVLSFCAKASSGYWNLFDPNNGYTAISGKLLRKLPLDKISKRFFFESDMLLRIYLEGAKVRELKMKAIYSDEKSNLNVLKVIPEFSYRHMLNLVKRIAYVYFIRNFNFATICLLSSILFFCGFLFLLILVSLDGNTQNFFDLIETHKSIPILGFSGLIFLFTFLVFDIKRSKE